MRPDYPQQIRLAFQGECIEVQVDEEQPIAVLESDDYRAWTDGIANSATRARITRDVGKMRRGLFGDWKETDGIFEMRLHYGPGYRVYYGRYRDIVVVLLGGGDKSRQRADLAKARRLWEVVKSEITEI